MDCAALSLGAHPQNLLAPHGRFYLVVLDANKPQELLGWFRTHTRLTAEVRPGTAILVVIRSRLAYLATRLLLLSGAFR